MGMQAGVDDDSFGHWSSCYVSYKGKGSLEIMMGLYSGDCCNGGSVQILNLYFVLLIFMVWDLPVFFEESGTFQIAYVEAR